MAEKRVYKLEYLPVARKDMIEIVRYISVELKNPDAAERLAVNLTEAAENLLAFPYAESVHPTIRPLKHEYRKICVKNYMMFYRIDEDKKLVVIARVIYVRRNIGRLLD